MSQMEASAKPAKLPFPSRSIDRIPLPTLLTAFMLIISLAGSPAWGRPPVKPQKNHTPAPPPAQQNDETISGFLPSETGMETELGSTLCSGLWTHSTYECFFPPNPQLCAGSRPVKPLTQPDKLKGQSQPGSRGKNQLTESSKQGAQLTTQLSPEGPNPGDIHLLDDELLPDDQIVLNEEASLTLAECSRLISAYIEHPEWLDFMDSGRHATTQTTSVNNAWASLALDTVSPADKETPFPALTPFALERLMQLSPSISRLYRQLEAGKNPLADKDDLRAFIKNADQNKGELFARGSHSLVIKWYSGPGYVCKIARSERDSIRLKREQNLYLWLRAPDNLLLNLTTTPMRAAFSISGKPVLALRQVDGTARDRLLLMGQHHSLNERLDFALSVIMHFCQMYRRFLEKDVLLADRHDDNIGFNEIPLQGRKSMGLDDAILQVPVMLDLDPYWFGDQESREIQLHLPTWVPVAVGLLEEVFTPVNSYSQISKSRVEVIDQIRKFAAPVFSSSSSSGLTVTEQDNIETVLQSCINHWFQDINPEYSELQAEARSHIEPLLISLNQWDSTPRTVTEWNKRLQKSIREVLQWLNSWKIETQFSLLKDFTNEGIIKVPSTQEGTLPQDQQILTLLSMIHGKLRCQKCSRTFTKSSSFRKHWQHHQQKKLQHCEVCGGDFIVITEHERVHTGERPYRCQHCGRGFARANTLQRHLRTHSGDKPYQCELCDKGFTHPYTLKAHLRTHSDDKPYQCEHCGKDFALTTTLKIHLRTHSGDKPYQCVHCGRCFAQHNTLKGHLRTHSGDRPYKCEYCDKCFPLNSHLQVHLRTHSGDKPYRCEHCGKCFSQTGNLRRHLRTHSGDKPYKCEHCGKCFSQGGSLKRHLRSHSCDKPYKCEHCGKCFSQGGSLKRHLRSHSGDKPHKCEHCGKCFSQGHSLKRHLHTHSGDKP